MGLFIIAISSYFARIILHYSCSLSSLHIYGSIFAEKNKFGSEVEALEAALCRDKANHSTTCADAQAL